MNELEAYLQNLANPPKPELVLESLMDAEVEPPPDDVDDIEIWDLEDV